MKFFSTLAGALFSLILLQCGNPTTGKSDRFKLVLQDGKSIFTVGDKASLSIHSKGDYPIDSVALVLDGTSLGVYGRATNLEMDLSGLRLGKHELEARVYSEGETQVLSKAIAVLASERPKLYSYKILETYPHDPNAYTQGLEFAGDTLYESTGQYKQSTLRRTDYRTGEVRAQRRLEDEYFAEGITILNNKIYQLTWRERTGFIYDLNSLDRKGTFVYGQSNEGWGLCNDGKKIYKSDGTERIWILDPETLAEEDHIEIYTNSSKIPRVNELEWVDGRIYANIYQKDAIAIVNPKTGAVEGVIDLSELKKSVKGKKVDVLNGIAYRGELGVLYVTGKNWDKLFKIALIEK